MSNLSETRDARVTACGPKEDFTNLIILVLEARRLVLKGCQPYLAHIVDTSVVESKLEEVTIVKGFGCVSRRVT